MALRRQRMIPRYIFVVRFIDIVNDRLRLLMTMRGDLSSLVEEALSTAPLATMPVIRLVGRPARAARIGWTLAGSTTLSLSEEAKRRLNETAGTRQASKNAIVNSAVLWWLKHGFIGKGRRGELAQVEVGFLRNVPEVE